MKLKKPNYYGIDHSKINEKFEGDFTFVNDMIITGHKEQFITGAVYHAKNPDTSKGYKEYMFISGVTDPVLMRTQYFVSGRTAEEIQQDRFVTGLLCNKCSTVVYSVNRYHKEMCECDNEAFIDGGRDYIRSGAKNMADTTHVQIDLLTDNIKKL